MYNSKTKKPLDSIRRPKCDADFKGFTFSCLRKVKDSLLALRAYISLYWTTQGHTSRCSFDHCLEVSNVASRVYISHWMRHYWHPLIVIRTWNWHDFECYLFSDWPIHRSRVANFVFVHCLWLMKLSIDLTVRLIVIVWRVFDCEASLVFDKPRKE